HRVGGPGAASRPLNAGSRAAPTGCRVGPAATVACPADGRASERDPARQPRTILVARQRGLLVAVCDRRRSTELEWDSLEDRRAGARGGRTSLPGGTRSGNGWSCADRRLLWFGPVVDSPLRRHRPCLASRGPCGAPV